LTRVRSRPKLKEDHFAFTWGLAAVRSTIRNATLFAVLVFFGCGGGGGPTDPGDETPSPAGMMVGSWIASSLVLTNQANPQQSGDIVEQFQAVFTMDVQESGRYLAILSAFGQSSMESGRLSVSGNILTMRRESPSETTSVAEISQQGSDIVMDGETEFDFNQDGTLEPSDLHMVLTPRN
jgi:hypothetical protein